MDFTEDKGREVLEPYHERLFNCLLIAWRKWLALAASFPDPLPRTRANIVYQFIVDEARRQLEPQRGVHWVKSRGRLLLNIRDQLVIGFKKLDEHLHTNNYPTLWALRYDAQLDLEGIPSRIPRLTVGYRLKNFETEIDYFVVFSIERRVQWCYELRSPTWAGVLPLPVTTPILTDQPPLVRIRETALETENAKPKRAAKIKK